MGDRRSILLADDEVILRNRFRTALYDAGYAVLAAADGAEALELSRSHEGDLDLLLTVVHLPVLDGVSLYRQISGERPDTKVLFMSGSMSLPIELPRNVPFLRKRLRPDTLCAKVDKILTERPTAAIDLKVILVVDHDESRRERTKRILTDAYYVVLTAGTVPEAKAASDSIAQIDLIISGIIFPGLSGVHLVEHVGASDRDINTLLISHFSRDLLGTVPGFQRQPQFLSNPFTPEALLARVRELLK
jgi:CheY-like chemotaxis protein